MPRRKLTTTLAGSLLIGLLLATHASTAAALTFGACPDSAGLSCTTLPVPLDRTGAAPGTIALSVERKAAGATQSQSAVLALAGGPGQAADPLSELLAKAIAPALHTRDLLIFDQRGTGRSDPLNCPVFNDERALESATESTFGALVELCALQIGPARGGFHDEGIGRRHRGDPP